MNLQRFHVLFVLVFCHSCNSNWTIQLSEEPITSVPYGSARLAVWKNGNNDSDKIRKYYVMPLVQLMNQSMLIVENWLTKRIQLEFKIVMWSEEVSETVLSHLRQYVDKSIGEDDVSPLPMYKVRLLWKDRLNPLDSAYRLANQWRSNTAMSSVLTFQIVCRELDACTSLKNAVNTSPGTLYCLELDYVINGAQSKRRLVTVGGHHAVGGELYTKLANMSTSSRFRYLTSEHAFALAKQTVANAVSSIKRESNYVDNSDEATLTAMLQTRFQSQAVPATNLRAEEWDAVYWSPARVRPDKIVQYLNRVLSTNPDSSEDLLLDIGWRTISEGLEILLNLQKMFNNSSNDLRESNSKTPINKSLVLSRLRDDAEGRTVLWTGSEFREKATPLYRLNLDGLSVSRKLVKGPIEVGEYRTVGSVKVKPPEAVPQKTGLELARRHRDEVNETVEALRRRIQAIASYWPEYCKIADHYCSNGTYAATTGKTLSECKLACEERPQCQSFHHVPYNSN